MLGKGDASERDHLRRLLPRLPGKALVVTDAGFNGYDLAAAILGSGASFLIRMSSTSRLFVAKRGDPARFTQVRVSYWPERARQAGRPPLELRLIRIRARRGKDPIVFGTRFAPAADTPPELSEWHSDDPRSSSKLNPRLPYKDSGWSGPRSS